jgi:hypothetical protein
LEERSIASESDQWASRLYLLLRPEGIDDKNGDSDENGANDTDRHGIRAKTQEIQQQAEYHSKDDPGQAFRKDFHDKICLYDEIQI